MNEHQTPLDQDDLTHVRRLIALGNILHHGICDGEPPETSVVAATKRLRKFLRHLSDDELAATEMATATTARGYETGAERTECASVPIRQQQLIVLREILLPTPSHAAEQRQMALACVTVWLCHTPTFRDGPAEVLQGVAEVIGDDRLSLALDFVDRRWLHPHSGRGQSSYNEYQQEDEMTTPRPTPHGWHLDRTGDPTADVMCPHGYAVEHLNHYDYSLSPSEQTYQVGADDLDEWLADSEAWRHNYCFGHTGGVR